MKKVILGLVMICGVGLGQAPTTPTVIQLAEQPLTTVGQVGVIYSGVAGSQFYCYWVVAKYGVGDANISSPSCLTINANGGGHVVVNWGAQGTGSDVLRTTSNVMQNPCSNCLLASNTANSTVTDSFAQNLASYQATPYALSNATFSIANTSGNAAAVDLNFKGTTVNLLSGGGGGGGAPTGPCGGDLGGSYPNCTVVSVAHIVSGILSVVNGGNGTATPALTAGSGIGLTGSWPAYTISETANTRARAIGYVFGNSGSAALTAPITVYIPSVPFACTISKWTVIASPSDTATVDILKIASGSTLPSASITGSGIPTITAATVAGPTTPSGWGSTAVAANDIMGIKLKTVGGTAVQVGVVLECDE